MLDGSHHPIKLRIAIFRTSSIGDVILSTACIDLIKKLNFNVEITWIGSEPSLDLIRRSYPEVRCMDIKAISSTDQATQILTELGNVNFLVDLQTNLRSKWFAVQLYKRFGIKTYSIPKMQIYRTKQILRARIRGRRLELSDQDLLPEFKQHQLITSTVEAALKDHLPIEYLDKTNYAPVRPLLQVENPLETPWQQELSFSRWLAISPGAAHKTKRAPKEVFGNLLEKLSHSPLVDQLGLVVLGNEEDRQDANDLLKSAFWPGPTMNLAGRLSLWESTIALLESELLLCNDSALAHIAEAVGTPVAVMFGPTIETFGFGPHLEQSRSFSAKLGCRPCSKHGKKACRYDDQRCFYDIDLDELLSFTTSRLNSPRK